MLTIADLKDNEETATMLVCERQVELRDQLRDYQFRGQQLSSYSLYDFILNTYEISLHDNDPTPENITEVHTRTRGRQKSLRIPYLPEADKPLKCRVERIFEHETILRFIGQWIPHQKFEEPHGACILLLLKPWRQLHDLKSDHESFAQTLTTFLDAASQDKKELIENMQYYHTCWDVAQERRDALRQGKPFKLFDYERDGPPTTEGVIDDDSSEGEGQTEAHELIPSRGFVDEDSIERARLHQRDVRDRVFADEAMRLAHAANVFENGHTTKAKQRSFLPRRANGEDMEVISYWAAMLKDITLKQLMTDGQENLRVNAHHNEISPSLQLLDHEHHSQGTPNLQTVVGDAMACPNRPLLGILNAEQKKAHDIIERSVFGSK